MDAFIWLAISVVVLTVLGLFGVSKIRDRPPQKYFIVFVIESRNERRVCNDIIDIHPFRWQMDKAVVRSFAVDGPDTMNTLMYYRKISDDEYDNYNEPIDTLWS